MGVGAGCITIDQLAVGRRQATAIADVTRARDIYLKENGIYVPVYGDGGVKKFSDIVIAYALGADIVMAGRLIAGAPETPNTMYRVRFLLPDGSTIYEGDGKEFWYEASKRAQELAEGKIRDYTYRYEEGIEGWVRAIAPLEDYLTLGFAKIRDSVRKAGSKSIEELHANAILELSQRKIDPTDPDLAIWSPKYVEVEVDGNWIRADSEEFRQYQRSLAIA